MMMPAGLSVRYLMKSYAASLFFEGAATNAPSTVIHGRIGLSPASLIFGSGARPYWTLLAISPRNQGPLKIIAVLPSLKSAGMSAVDGSAGRIASFSNHFKKNSRAFIFAGFLVA